MKMNLVKDLRVGEEEVGGEREETLWWRWSVIQWEVGMLCWGRNHLTPWNVKNPCLPGLRLVADVNRASAAASLGLSLTALPVLLSCGVYLVLTVEFRSPGFTLAVRAYVPVLHRRDCFASLWLRS